MTIQEKKTTRQLTIQENNETIDHSRKQPDNKLFKKTTTQLTIQENNETMNYSIKQRDN